MVALSVRLGSRALGQRISEIVCRGRNLDHGQRKWLEMMGFRSKGLLARFQIPKCSNKHNSDRIVGQ